jgi:hypothetical protein
MNEQPKKCDYRDRCYLNIDRCKLNYNCQCIQDLAEIFNGHFKIEKCPILLAKGIPIKIKKRDECYE